MVVQRAFKVLIIEDDATIGEGIQTVLEKEGYRVVTAADGTEGSRLFRKQAPDLVISDLKLPGKSGLQLLQEFQAASSSLPVILISAYGTIDLAVQALKSGARDFIAKPFSIDELRMKVNQILEEVRPAEEDREGTFHGMVGSSAPMNELYARVSQVAAVGSPVLISGESGTGKELIARAIHSESRRKGKTFLAVNCGAFTETLLESELFGHEKGAFTGAVRQHQGIFEQAHGGTILLDEIGEISPPMQVKLLRVLQEQVFQRVGGSEEIKTDVRIIAATNQDLKEAIKKRAFREDLYYRLNVLPLQVPPLRERAGDIPELVDYIVNNKSPRLGRKPPRWSETALKKISSYPWPGNIRELENFLERLLIFTRRDTIRGEDIYFDELTRPGSSATLTGKMKNTEYQLIVEALQQSGGVKQQAARLLGLKTSTLYYKMEKYGLMERKGDT